MNSPLPETDEPNPFEGFSAAEVFGFVHRKFGEEGLRELLNMFDDLTCEFLEDAASELEAAGLSKPAAILATLATTAPSEFDIGNPYAEGSFDWHYWRANWIRKRQETPAERAERMRQEQRKDSRAPSLNGFRH